MDALYRKNLDEKATKCKSINYSIPSKAYKLYDTVNEKVIISRDVVFNEESSWNVASDLVDTSIKLPSKMNQLVIPMFLLVFQIHRLVLTKI